MAKTGYITTLSSDDEGKQIVSSIGMTVLLVSFSMLFATLFLGYAVFRASNQVWPPMGIDRVDLFTPAISTALIFLSSVTYYFMESDFAKSQFSNSRVWYVLTILLGAGFIISQFMLWAGMNEVGIFLNGGIFPSILYGFTWIHAAHMVMGMIALLIILPVLIDCKNEFKYRLRIKNVGKFWHFLGVV